MEATTSYLTYRYRVKDATSGKHLARMARAVNFVWNYCGDVQEHARKWGKKWPSYYELSALTAGCAAELGLHSKTVSTVCREFAKARDEFRRRPRWRSAKRSLGWIPFSHAKNVLRLEGDVVVYRGARYRLWLDRPITGQVRHGAFSQDATGRWYLSVVCEVENDRNGGIGEIGVDLGLKDLAACSDGVVVENPRHVHKHAERLAKAQRAGRKKLACAIHRKVTNARRDHLHKVSAAIVRENSLIVVGDVSSSKLAKTRMAKSVLDAGWYEFKRMLRYKSALRRGAFVEVDERWSTRTCSDCGVIGGPKGLEGLGVRRWICECGAHHDRDVNAARNILASGRSVALQDTGIAKAKALSRRARDGI